MAAQWDQEIGVGDVQALAHADAVAAFFARLGYDISVRVSQTPGAMGMPAQTLRRKIRHIERIADQDSSTLQVYLVELDSVTVQATQALARALRDRTPNFLLVLTDDYERLDFVLLEREAPPTGAGGHAQPRVTVRPRVLTVDRRKPDLVSMRVLRRLSYTESDADAQYDKLRSAYAIAEWSEPLFNNRALFSDYYLNHRLPGTAAWAEDPKPVFLRLRELYRDARERLASQDDATVRSAFWSRCCKCSASPAHEEPRPMRRTTR